LKPTNLQRKIPGIASERRLSECHLLYFMPTMMLSG
jgi:hypothetical protein